jgi:hypothetical protein
MIALVILGLTGCSSGGGSKAVGGLGTTTTTPIPLGIQVMGTTGLKDGQGVKVHVTANQGSLVYGFEATLCKGGTAYRFDADMRPTLTGKCIPHPFSAASDDYQEVRAAAPYLVADTVFRAGVGTENFALENGMPVTIACGPGHPCDLVLKVQYPYGFAIRAYPLSYA